MQAENRINLDAMKPIQIEVEIQGQTRTYDPFELSRQFEIFDQLSEKGELTMSKIKQIVENALGVENMSDWQVHTLVKYVQNFLMEFIETKNR